MKMPTFFYESDYLFTLSLLATIAFIFLIFSFR